jgi:hypothetical protein
MSRAFHEACNTTLRTAAAELTATGLGGFAFLGCFMNEDGLGWATLPGLTRALAEAAERHRSGDAEFATVYDAITAITERLVVTDCPDDAEHLIGIALVSNIDDGDRGRVCLVDAVFADTWRHTVTWYADEDTPSFTVTSPPEQTDSGLPGLHVMPGLLAAVLRATGHGDRVVGEEQRELSVCLRDQVAELTAARENAVVVITRTNQGWEVFPVNDLSASVGAALEYGAAMDEAIGMVAEKLTADPPETIPTLQGVGTVVHFDYDDGTTAAQLFAVAGRVLHAASWTLGHHQPDWEILPVPTTDIEYQPRVAAYTQLLEALRGTSR